MVGGAPPTFACLDRAGDAGESPRPPLSWGRGALASRCALRIFLSLGQSALWSKHRSLFCRNFTFSQRGCAMRKVVLGFLLVVGLTIGMGGTAKSTELWSPPLHGTAGPSYSCGLTNAGKDPLELTIQFFNNLGNPESGPALFVIAPNAAGSFTISSLPGDVPGLHCKITFKGSDKDVRGIFTATDPIVSGSSPVVALPVR